MTTATAPRPAALLLHDIAAILADLLRRGFQCERVATDALSRDADDPALDLHGARQAIEILGADLDRIAQDCIDQGILDTSGDLALEFKMIKGALDVDPKAAGSDGQASADTTYTKAELADAVREARQMNMLQDLDEKLEAVQHFFEVENCIPDRVRRPTSHTKEDA